MVIDFPRNPINRINKINETNQINRINHPNDLNQKNEINETNPINPTNSTNPINPIFYLSFDKMILNGYTSHIETSQNHRGPIHRTHPMIFIAGVYPKTKTIDSNPRLCPLCGGAQAYLKRIDHYLSIFFIPIFPVSRGKPSIICERCGGISDEMGHGIGMRGTTGDLLCRRCGRALRREFDYCPYCGKLV